MIPPGSLGAILSAIIAERPAPPPTVDEAVNLAADCTFRCARHLTTGIAYALGISWEDAWDEMVMIPDNLLFLLASPEGWTALVGYIAKARDIDPVILRPTIQ